MTEEDGTNESMTAMYIAFIIISCLIVICNIFEREIKGFFEREIKGFFTINNLVMITVLFICWFGMWVMKRFCDKRDWMPWEVRVIVMWMIYCAVFCLTLIYIAPYMGYNKIY